MLQKLFNITNGDVITVVGSGGKTSLINTISKESNFEKILLTTTTKILKDEFLFIDYQVIGNEINKNKYQKQGKYLVYDYLIEELNKVVGFDKKIIEKITPNFNLSLIEGDGSKSKDLKGWKAYEPVVLSNTTKTIGIINFNLLEKNACEKNIHNLSEFITISNLRVNGIIREENLINLICHPKGLFKNAIGEKILFINQLDTDEKMAFAERFAEDLLEIFNIKIVIGSLKFGVYKEVRY